VARRIVDRRVLHLIKMWLECPVEETDQRGRTTRTTEARDSRRGIPQGLTAVTNCWQIFTCAGLVLDGEARLEQSSGHCLVNYADDTL